MWRLRTRFCTSGVTLRSPSAGCGYFAFVGLWHQLTFLWDWTSLDIWDAIQGYALLLVFVGLLTFYLSFESALVCLALALVAFVGGFIGMGANRR